MASSLIPILIGALAYAGSQLLWYSPLMFGRCWRELRGLSSESALRAAGGQGGLGASVQSVILPAFLMSFAFTVLSQVVAKMGGEMLTFVSLSFVLVISLSLPKYVFSVFSGKPVGRLEYVQDGAFFFGTLLTVSAIIASSRCLPFL